MKNKLVISASRRTDIPAFYGEWFFNRLKAGYCLVKNPFNPKQVSKVSLKREDVEAFIFWTRNPMPFMKVIDELLRKNYHFGFFVTLTGYSRLIETNRPEISRVMKGLEKLAQKIGREKIIWRYDPIILSEKMDFNWHLDNFKNLAEMVAPFVDACVISFVDFYKKTRLNLKKVSGDELILEPLSEPGLDKFLADLKSVGNRNGLALYNCCETAGIFSKVGIDSPGCINLDWLKKITDKNLIIKKHKGQRKECECVFSRDIGAYNTCLHGCLYCYATRDHETAKQRNHDPLSEFL